MEARGFYWSEIEIYPRPGSLEDRAAAGVWQPGHLETRLLDGLHCDADAPHDVVDVPIEGEPDDRLVFSHCELLKALEAAGNEGFRAVDFERYNESGEDGEETWAVLLHRRAEEDWLLFGDLPVGLDFRELRLNPPLTGTTLRRFSYRLVDFDFLGLSDHIQSQHRASAGDRIRLFPEIGIPNHNGLVHDGGTSGPPGG